MRKPYFRIGQIVPSSNTTMETEIPAMLRARETILPERFTFHSSVQKPSFNLIPWSAILLVTGIVTYVGVLDEIGSIKFLEASIERLGGGSVATLITSYVVGVVSAFASTTGTLSAITPIVVPLAASTTLSPVGVVSAISVSSSVVDISPMSTTGALLMTNAEPNQERTFFQALLLWAILMIGVVPAIAWLVFVVL